MKGTKWASSTAAITALLLANITLASAEAPGNQTRSIELSVAPEPIESFNFCGRLDSWRAVDRDTLIIWSTPFRPYLIELGRPSHRLRFAQVIGISSTVGRVHSRLDEVYIDGVPYQIKTIHRLTPLQARQWNRT